MDGERMIGASWAFESNHQKNLSRKEYSSLKNLLLNDLYPLNQWLVAAITRLQYQFRIKSIHSAATPMASWGMALRRILRIPLK